MEKPTKRAPVVTKTAPAGPFQTQSEDPSQAPDKPISYALGQPLLGAVPLHVQITESRRLRAELRRIERLEASLFPGRLPKP